MQVISESHRMTVHFPERGAHRRGRRVVAFDGVRLVVAGIGRPAGRGPARAVTRVVRPSEPVPDEQVRSSAAALVMLW